MFAPLSLVAGCDENPIAQVDQVEQVEHVNRDERGLDAQVEGAFAFATERLNAVIGRLKVEHPDDYQALYPTDTATSGPTLGQWKLHDAYDWRSGFFPGALWKMYERTGDPAFFRYAKAWTSGIEVLADAPIDYDLGCRFFTSFGQAYRLSNDGNDPGGAYRSYARKVLLRAAAALDTRFDKGGVPVGALRSLDDYMSPYPVYIDGLMNLELLFLGWDLSGRPASGPERSWYEHAIASAETVMRENVREDGSTYHIVQFNDGTVGTPPDGRVYAKITDQGYGDETTWSRGQAWGMYGFTMVYRYTKDDPNADPARFLRTAQKLADYFIAHLPNNFTDDPYNHVRGDFVPPTDFNAALGEPAGPYNDANGDHVFGDRRPPSRSLTPRDSSAAAVASSALFELAKLAHDPADQARYRRAAEDILLSLLTFEGPDGKLAYLAKNSVHRGILANGSVAWGYPQSSLIYGDYYLLEAMNRYQAR